MQKRFYRSTKEKMLFGVCGGIADYFELDPVIIRLGFIVSVFLSGIGVLAYIACAIVMPKRDASAVNEPALPINNEPAGKQNSESAEVANSPSEKKRVGANFFGVLLIVVGSLFFLHNFIIHIHFSTLMPIILITIGVWLLSMGFFRKVRNAS